MKRIALIWVLLLLIFAFGAYADEVIYPTTIGSLKARATVIGHGSIAGLKEGEEARFQVLTFQDTEFQAVSNTKEELHINGNTIYPQYILDEFGNKYLLFHIKENGDFNYEITADIERKALAYDITDYNITDPPQTVKQYTLPTDKVESNSTEILTLENNKIYGNSFVSTLNQTVDWVNDYVIYPKVGTPEYRKYYLEQYSAVETLINKEGVCDEFSNLGAAILRAKKIPTRLAIGLTFDGEAWGNHAWIEVYHEKLQKWIPSDPTFRESGFVDAMHLKMGAFDDVTSSKAKCFYPETAKCTIENQSDMPQVTILSKEYLANVKLDSNIETLIANVWNDVPITITNITDSTLSVPIRLQNINPIVIQKSEMSVIIAPGKKANVIFKLMPLITMEENKVATGKIIFNSLSEPYEKSITVTPNNVPQTGEVIVNDVTPIAHEGTLKIQITATNYYTTDKQIKIGITGNNYSSSENETMPAFSTKTVTKEIDNYVLAPYDINITTPIRTLMTEIIPVKSQSSAPQQPKKDVVIEQKLPTEGQQTNLQEKILDSPIAIILGLLAGIIVLLFGLFLVNKRYV